MAPPVHLSSNTITTILYCPLYLNNIICVTGITNHDEYSLVHELPDEEKEKTLTMRRGQSIAKDQKKLDELKKKLHTDDECRYHKGTQKH